MYQKLRNRSLRHILFWLLIISLTSVRFIFNNSEYTYIQSLAYNASYLIIEIILSYFLVYILIPNFYLTKRYVVFALSVLASLYFSTILLDKFLTYVVFPNFGFDAKPHHTTELWEQNMTLFVKYGVSIVYIVGLFVSFYYFSAYIKEKERALLLSNEKSQAELKHLKAQLNPHFLFNTLNNIYSLSLMQSPKAPAALGKLAEILDYTLYRCNSDYISILKEIELAKNYIDLEKIRYDERLKIELDSHVSYDTQIPPLLILTLVENAFKHGASEDENEPSIWIEIFTTRQETSITVKNTVSKTEKTSKDTAIGLYNIRQQLNLLFPGRHHVNIETNSGLFRVNIKMEHV